MKAQDPDYTTYVALTKIATKEDPIRTKRQLNQALTQIKATTALTSRINARTSADRLKVQAQQVQVALLELKSKLK